MRESALVLTTWLLAAVPSPGSAQGWDDYLAPDAARGERLFARAMEHVVCALDADECVPDVDSAMLGPEVEWEQALVRLDRALRYLPDDPDVLFFRALALARWERDDGDTIARRVPEAIEAYEHLRATHPEVAPPRVAYELAILRTRERDYAGAAAEYERFAQTTWLGPVVPQLIDPSSALARITFELIPFPIEVAYGNWAEVTMLAGDAGRATELYTAAMEFEGNRWPNGALARFGLGLALERAGSHDAALAAIHDAIDVEPPSDPDDPSYERVRGLVHRFGSFAALHDEGVFFEPECEIHAYEALGNEALAADSRSAEGRRARLSSALRLWRAFLSEGGRDGVWAARAGEAIVRLEALLAD